MSIWQSLWRRRGLRSFQISTLSLTASFFPGGSTSPVSTRPTIIDVPLRKAVEHLTEANGVSFSQVQSVVLQVMVFSCWCMECYWRDSGGFRTFAGVFTTTELGATSPKRDQQSQISLFCDWVHVLITKEKKMKQLDITTISRQMFMTTLASVDFTS